MEKGSTLYAHVTLHCRVKPVQMLNLLQFLQKGDIFRGNNESFVKKNVVFGEKSFFVRENYHFFKCLWHLVK